MTRATYIVGLLLVSSALATSVVVGCSSARSSTFDDGILVDASMDASSPSFGGEASSGCQGLRCLQKTCAGGADTMLSGTVFAPNGALPLYNAIVYVPNSKPLPFTKGATCDKCGVVTGDPIVSAVTDANGKFVLKNVPPGKDIPLVVQIGKWRRQVKIPVVPECTETKLTDPEMTRLPRKQSEGDMPQIALTTGGCDKLGCMLPKVGIDPSEFGVEADGPKKAVHTYLGQGTLTAPAGAPVNAPTASALWSDLVKLKQYDLAILSCECEEHLEGKGGSTGSTAFGAVADYLALGGRIFTSDFMYTWYRYSASAPMKSAVEWRGDAPLGGSPLSVDSSFPKGKALADWLQVVGATNAGGELTPDYVFGNIISLDTSKVQTWASSGDPLPGARVFTVNAPVGVTSDQQCGKGVHFDAHVNQGGADVVDETYPAGCETPLKPAENLLAFFFFDLAACIQNEGDAPMPPVVK